MGDLGPVLAELRAWAVSERESGLIRVKTLGKLVAAIDAYNRVADQGPGGDAAPVRDRDSELTSSEAKLPDGAVAWVDNPLSPVQDDPNAQVEGGFGYNSAPPGVRKQRLLAGSLGVGAPRTQGGKPLPNKVHVVFSSEPMGWEDRYLTKWLCKNTSTRAESAPEGAEITCEKCLRVKEGKKKVREPDPARQEAQKAAERGRIQLRASQLAQKAVVESRAAQKGRIPRQKYSWPSQTGSSPPLKREKVICSCGCGMAGWESKITGHTRNCACSSCGLHREELVRSADRRRAGQAASMRGELA